MLVALRIMPVGLTILFLVLASYFLAAAIVPRIRIRCGAGAGASITVSRQGLERSKYKYTKPRMGAVTCLGFGTFVGGFALGGLVPRAPVLHFVAAGLVLMAVGAILDWLREPPRHTKK